MTTRRTIECDGPACEAAVSVPRKGGIQRGWRRVIVVDGEGRLAGDVCSAQCASAFAGDAFLVQEERDERRWGPR